MSTHVQCPSCGQHAGHIVSPDRRWGELYDECTMEAAAHTSCEDDDFDWFELEKSDGRETFECTCGRAIWIADRGTLNRGRWFVSNDDEP